MAMECEYNRQQGHEVYWGARGVLFDLLKYNVKDGKDVFFDEEKIVKLIGEHIVIQEPEGFPFLSLPAPDRVFTRAKEYTSGNYKYLPGTHIMSASGCWHGKCTFCVEQNKPYEVRSVDDVINELWECKKLGFREVFDDSGTFPTGRWLDEFLKSVSKLNLVLGCNMRMLDIDYKSMQSAGFRLLLFGVESANQHTLDRINKGVKVEDIRYIIKAAKARIDCHLAVMFGYPWETDADAVRTLSLVHWLLRKGYAKTAQASFFTQQGVEGNKSQRHFIRDIYGVWKYPEFWFNQIRNIHNTDDLKYLWRKIKKGITRD
jgi:radical SAM superfamily enzyme YgiQ (UPF0313 family)